MSYHNVRGANGRFAPKGTTTAKKTRKAAKRTTPKKGTTILSAFLMDSSGSMGGKETATISGFNEILTNARNDSAKYGTPSVELIAFFGNSYKFSGEVKELTLGRSGISKDGKLGYAADMGGTALWESTYKLIDATEQKLATLPKGTKVIVTIFTDGEENASSIEWSSGTKIKGIIEAKQAEGWVINFIGAGNEAYVKSVATSVGIFASNTANYTNTAAGTKGVMAKMSQARSYYSAAVADGVDSNVGFFSND